MQLTQSLILLLSVQESYYLCLEKLGKQHIPALLLMEMFIQDISKTMCLAAPKQYKI